MTTCSNVFRSKEEEEKIEMFGSVQNIISSSAFYFILCFLPTLLKNCFNEELFIVVFCCCRGGPLSRWFQFLINLDCGEIIHSRVASLFLRSVHIDTNLCKAYQKKQLWKREKKKTEFVRLRHEKMSWRRHNLANGTRVVISWKRREKVGWDDDGII